MKNHCHVDQRRGSTSGQRRGPSSAGNPLDGEVATRAPAASVADAIAAVDAAASAFPAWSATGPGERRSLLMRAAQVLEDKHATFVSAMAAETGASAIWAGFNVHLAASGLMEAAALTTQIAGEVIPSDVPGSLAMGIRQTGGCRARDRAVERAGDPCGSCYRTAARVRQTRSS